MTDAPDATPDGSGGVSSLEMSGGAALVNAGPPCVSVGIGEVLRKEGGGGRAHGALAGRRLSCRSESSEKVVGGSFAISDVV